MSVVAAEIIAYASANMPGNTANGATITTVNTAYSNGDTSTSGGAIDATSRVIFTDIAAADTVQVLSSAADTRTVSIVGRNAAGTVVTETLTLNGVTAVTSANTYQRINSATLSAGSATLTMTLRRTTGATTIATIGGTAATSTEIAVVRLFRNATVPASSSTVRYEKFFWKNTNASLSLLAAQIQIATDNTTLATKSALALATTIGDSGSAANRVTLPTGITGFSAVATPITLNTATGTPDLAAGSAIGCWVRLTTASTDGAQDTTIISQVDGNST